MANNKQLAIPRDDRIFRSVITGAGVSLFLLLGAIAVFLILKAVPALQSGGFNFFTRSDWFPDASPASFGIVALAFGTVLSSALALIISLPVAIGAALFAVELCPKRFQGVIATLVDLLAAVPSVVYGLWAIVVLVPDLMPFERWLNSWFGWIPLLDNTTGAYGRSVFAAAVILAIMILPIISAIAREVFKQVPRANKEAALALGATRWEMIRLAVLPYGRGGLVGAAMLGVGRALGETIAVALVLAATYNVNWHILEPGGNTIAANIATKFGESGANGRSALIASGLVLFAITLLVSALARLLVRRGNRRLELARP